MKKISELLNPYRGLRKEIYIIFISRTINAMGAFIFPFMTLILREKIGLSESETGVWIAISGLMYAPASLIGGKLSDKFGRKKLLITFETLGVLGYGLAIFVEPNMVMVYLLMVSSFLFGVAGPSHDAITADLTSTEQREGAYSLNYLGFNLGFAIAQIFGGFLFYNHLKLMFVIDVITAIIGITLIALFVKETLNSNCQTQNIQKNKLEQKEQGSVLRVLWARPILIYYAIAAFGYRFVYSQWQFMIPLHATSNFGKEPGAILFGLLGSFNATIVVVFTPILTMLFYKKTNIKRIIYAGVLFTIGFGLLGFISVRTAFFASVFIFTLGEILEAISMMPFIMNHTPASHRGRMSSIIPMLMGVGYSVGPLVMGSVLEATSFEFSWKLSGGIGLMATFLMKGLDIYDKRKKLKGNEEPTKEVIAEV